MLLPVPWAGEPCSAPAEAGWPRPIYLVKQGRYALVTPPSLTESSEQVTKEAHYGEKP
jgi:hypothetical protein